MHRFLICIHDATPAHADETRAIIRDLAPLVAHRLCFGVVPDWHGEWPLSAHAGYCRFMRENSHELLLHGCFHQRRRGRGAVTWLTGGSDEMNGLDPDETRRTLDRGQRVFADVFDQRARGFLAPAWQAGQVHRVNWDTLGLEYMLGYFSLKSRTGRSVPLATWTWDCGRWSWLGHVGHALGSLLHATDRRVPVLAIHPADLRRDFRPEILRLTRDLLDAGYEPTTPAGLLEASDAEVHV